MNEFSKLTAYQVFLGSMAGLVFKMKAPGLLHKFPEQGVERSIQHQLFLLNPKH